MAHKTLTVKQLKDALEKFDDDDKVMICASRTFTTSLVTVESKYDGEKYLAIKESYQ